MQFIVAVLYTKQIMNAITIVVLVHVVRIPLQIIIKIIIIINIIQPGSPHRHIQTTSIAL
jgi:hypothetical protein